jgi:hypothetical protein
MGFCSDQLIRLVPLWCTGALLLATTSWAHDPESLRVRDLVKAGKTKQPIEDTDAWATNPLRPADIPEVMNYIKEHPGYSSYHLLVTLRKYFPSAYRQIASGQKAAILCSNLTTVIAMNDWGNPVPPYDAEAAKALLELGKDALGPLVPVLKNNTAALLNGSDEATDSMVYHFRRKDFAYRYISLILGRRPKFSEDVRARDLEIDRLEKIVKERSK